MKGTRHLLTLKQGRGETIHHLAHVPSTRGKKHCRDPRDPAGHVTAPATPAPPAPRTWWAAGMGAAGRGKAGIRGSPLPPEPDPRRARDSGSSSTAGRRGGGGGECGGTSGNVVAPHVRGGAARGLQAPQCIGREEGEEEEQEQPGYPWDRVALAPVCPILGQILPESIGRA